MKFGVYQHWDWKWEFKKCQKIHDASKNVHVVHRKSNKISNPKLKNLEQVVDVEMIPNLLKVCMAQGFCELEIRYVEGKWVQIAFASSTTGCVKKISSKWGDCVTPSISESL
ncbi:hypothetical protein L1987_06735 [Smallanthus sonchifolius]|uniref:Uncharacterized protein n=1 Tax=Smallanthus sonchifolius TaxID=185202 RepID=A0ACB9JYY2_9ASTR|nr:hypothetical protein L1987_06735 [Smallanthus sonchifolius]